MSKYPGAVQCLRCKKILVSFDRHDYKSCQCPNKTFVDGGHDYLRMGGMNMKLIQILKFVAVKRKEAK